VMIGFQHVEVLNLLEYFRGRGGKTLDVCAKKDLVEFWFASRMIEL